MSEPPFFRKLETEVTMEESPGAPKEHGPFRVAILGDFSVGLIAGSLSQARVW
jgi:hypothetical protein